MLLTDYMQNCNIFIIFHAWYQNTSVLCGIFVVVVVVVFCAGSCEVSLCSGCDRHNTFVPEMIISIYRL